ncbi:ENTH-domain-containing protein [Lactarius akahatsu]|uniref:ENTH-domain-containing protein n=1 Tax=Lactarius akahatsu TaxID=416441 RepID=A0AAD4LFK3_9AGAM|nr:ENTH-domain-containing protein [Lactarius akahatsu]
MRDCYALHHTVTESVQLDELGSQTFTNVNSEPTRLPTMDRLESLGNTLSNITLYDIKSMYNQAKNVVLNVSEMEAKVREATNDDPWGASSTLMLEIAQGTFNFQQFNEIMPCIYSQFMEKEARQWRQIYKASHRSGALQLLEYLVKHGSERVVDDARSHLSTLKMLRSFHYIDEKGKDQGVNVRNRSRELVELLADVEKIRRERKEAKANRTKYVVVVGSYSGDYGTNASGVDREYSSGSGTGFRDNTPRRSDFEEYDAGEYETTPRRATSSGANTSTNQTTSARTTTAQSRAASKAPEPALAPVVNLLDFDDDNAVPERKCIFRGSEDDFADFQAAPPSAPASATTTASPPAPAAAAKPSLMDLLSSTAAAPSPATYRPTTQTQPLGTFSTVLTPSSQVRPSSTPVTAPPSYVATSAARSAVTSPVSAGSTSLAGKSAAKSGGGGFDDLWSMSLGSACHEQVLGASWCWQEYTGPREGKGTGWDMGCTEAGPRSGATSGDGWVWIVHDECNGGERSRQCTYWSR